MEKFCARTPLLFGHCVLEWLFLHQESQSCESTEACQGCRLSTVSSDSTQTFFPSGWNSQIIAQEKNIITFQKTRNSCWKYPMNKTITGNKWGLPMMHVGFPCGSVVKNLPANAGDVGLIPGSGRSPGEGTDNWLQYPCLGNPVGTGAWQTIAHGVAKESDIT